MRTSPRTSRNVFAQRITTTPSCTSKDSEAARIPSWPMFGLESFAEPFRQATAAFNQEIRRIARELPVCDVRVIEIDELHERIMAHPHRFGFDNVTDACWASDGSVCAEPNEYYWFQASHPSERAHFAWAVEFIREARGKAPHCGDRQ